ncbi:erythronate-4-phosphate dehydrogenase [Thiosulfatimonas sediminis]|uniref:Erythronate-4-phosphate dehydrogenase n=1 Tax=Thiosulfatimonas sediminis TaxID=2675054 RepID=A0A6F8PX09_9GAMM|nr:4-phosphoerythronate dehydrogenase [Thiosulfatimonas sediminis]BBP46661.1 erythronate-4-phosphate dehydrogenase [Thiosulfatimonas sediminis]
MSQTVQRKLIIDDAVPYAKAIFGHLGNVISLPGRDIDAQAVETCDALIVRSRTQVNQALLANSNAQYIGSTVVGLDHIDQAYLSETKRQFYSAQGCNANSVAEFVLHALLLLAEKQGFDLSSKSLGIIGVGHVGKCLQQKAQALGMRCLLNDPPRARAEGTQAFSHLNETLQADIISVHTPLTFDGADKTYHLLDRAKLATLKPEQIIVNAARGGIIDEAALIDTVLAAKIIDCWENEPHINPDLAAQSFLISPHIAGHSFEAKLAGSTMVYADLCHFWQQPQQQDWQQNLPEKPAIIELSEAQEWQSSLLAILQNTHLIQNDDQAIRSDPTHFETYRRHYPVHHEWHMHRVKETRNQKLNEILRALNFTLCSESK